MHYKPVHGVSVALVHDDFGCQVLGRSAHGPGLVVHTLRKAKVRDADVATVVDEHVFRFEITENDVDVVQKVESKDSFSFMMLAI